METNEVLTRSDTVLWENTAASIKKWLPSLYEEKFVDTEIREPVSAPDKRVIKEVPDEHPLTVKEVEQVLTPQRLAFFLLTSKMIRVFDK